MDSDTLLYPLIIFIVVLFIIGIVFGMIFDRLHEPINSIYKVSAEPVCTVYDFEQPISLACGESYCSVINGQPTCALCDCQEAQVVPNWITSPTCWFWRLGRPECQ